MAFSSHGVVSVCAPSASKRRRHSSSRGESGRTCASTRTPRARSAFTTACPVYPVAPATNAVRTGALPCSLSAMRHRRLFSLLRDARVRSCALVLVLICALPASAHAHIRLESSLPAAGATVDAAPTLLRLRFSAHIEARYTSLTAVTAEGRRIPLDGFVFEPNSDRELTVPFPVLPPGLVTIEWRTAGADGHVLEGSFAFTIRAAPAAADTADPQTVAPPAEHQHDAHAAPAHDAVGPLDVTARALQFSALLL